MAAYITSEQLKAYVQNDMLTQALDDTGDGASDSGLFDTILEAVQAEIDGSLGGVYTVPFTTVPPFVKHASLILCANALWLRRGANRETNPFHEAAAESRRRLQALARREEKLDIAEPPGLDAGDLITEDSMTYDPQGRLML
jgi:phage gp36-like protein